MKPSDLDYSTEERIVGNFTKARRAMDMLNYTKEKIDCLITCVDPPEQKVAIALYRRRIREDEFLAMQSNLPINKPVVIKIANHLRDLWRKK